MVRSVLALLTGIALLCTSVAGYAYVRLVMTEDSDQATADSGIAACETLLALPETHSIQDVLDASTIADLKGSANADLKAAGAAMESVAALPPDQQLAGVDDLVTAIGQVVTGCTDLGVPLPAINLEPSPSASAAPA